MPLAFHFGRQPGRRILTLSLLNKPSYKPSWESGRIEPSLLCSHTLSQCQPLLSASYHFEVGSENLDPLSARSSLAKGADSHAQCVDVECHQSAPPVRMMLVDTAVVFREFSIISPVGHLHTTMYAFAICRLNGFSRTQ